jgi:anaerobic ribonucleoside-triphosphate reductase activating protein
MLKVASFDIVFQEIPGEVTLALNLSNCPCHCPGCHSPHLAEDIGEPLNEELMDGFIARYGSMITCVAFMGGDAEPEEVARWAEYSKDRGLKTAWYSGRTIFPGEPRNPRNPRTPSQSAFDYVKLGPYIEALGGLKSEQTNQRLYKRVGDEWEDITSSFWRKTL